VQYLPYQPQAGWGSERARSTEALLATLEAHAPGIRSSVTAMEFLTPADLEREFGISGGHWHHGELAFDQFYMVRPVPGAAQYRTPVAGLYLCGASCHPGGGVTGLAGRNAARALLREAA
jgi:phytoene dehydrogenase-like protein